MDSGSGAGLQTQRRSEMSKSGNTVSSHSAALIKPPTALLGRNLSLKETLIFTEESRQMSFQTDLPIYTFFRLM